MASNMFDFLQNIGSTELIIIGLILIVFFGAGKIAKLGRNAGEATKEIKKIKKDLSGAMDDTKSQPDDKKEEA